MTAEEPTIWDEFEIRGKWWSVESGPDAATNGRLGYIPNDDIVLDVDGQLTPAGTALTVVHGLSSDGRFVTLLGCQEFHQTVRMPGTVVTKYVVRRLLIGRQHVIAADAPFNDLRVGFNGLTKWLGDSPLQNSAARGGLLGLKKPQMIEGRWAFSCLQSRLTVRSCAMVAANGDAWSTLGATADGYLWLTPRDPKNLSWHLSIASDLRQLLTVLSGQEIFLTRLFVKPAMQNVSADGLREDPGWFQIFYPFRTASRPKDNETRRFVISAADLADDLPGVVAEWLRENAPVRALADLYAAVLLIDRFPAEAELLFLTQSLERYHRRRLPGRYMDDADYAAVSGALSAAIPAGLEESHRASLRARVRFGNEYSLRKRLAELMDRLDPTVAAMITDHRAGFIGQAVDTRNFYTHYPDDPAAAAGIVRGIDLWRFNGRLRLFIFALILTEFALPPQAIRMALSRSPDARRLV